MVTGTPTGVVALAFVTVLVREMVEPKPVEVASLVWHGEAPEHETVLVLVSVSVLAGIAILVGLMLKVIRVPDAEHGVEQETVSVSVSVSMQTTDRIQIGFRCLRS